MLARPETVGEITPAIDRANVRLFVGTQLLLYLAAPVLYVGVVQAAFCERLGAGATLANLPFAAFLLGGVLPLFCAWLVPAHREQRLLVWAFALTAASMLAVALVVFLPVPSGPRLAAVIGQGLLIGMLSTVTNVYLFKCLARGTTEAGRARAMKYGFGLGPVAAVTGSLLAQQVLNGRVPRVTFPDDFGLLYLAAGPCALGCAGLASRFQLRAAAPQAVEPLSTYLSECLGALYRDRILRSAALAFLLWYVALGTMTNLSLYAREAVGRAPIELAGFLLALRFGCKALAGFALGALALRWGVRWAVLATIGLVGLGAAWPLGFTGGGYLLAFGLMGAGELGGAYFPNYVIAVSPVARATRNLALLSLVGPLSGAILPLHGWLADHLGFRASFGFGAAMAVAACLVLGLTAVRPNSAPERRS
jgi:MFS family permease